jgi:SAM-dependent methyltransferase
MNQRYKSDLKRFRRIIPWIRGNTILDMGSKEGYVHKLLKDYYPEKNFLTLDISNSDFNINLNQPKKLSTKFDTIIAGEIIEHLDNPTNFLKFCYNHLNKGGFLILTTPNSIGIQYLRNPSWCVHRGDFDSHINSFTLPMLEVLIKRTNFFIEHTEYINAFWKNKNPLQLIPVIIPRLKTDILIVAKK